MTNDSEPTNLTLRRALHLARAGFVVFPCRQGQKRPWTKNGLLDATVDETTIRAWFANDRDLNLAVACGPQPNGINLLAIDIDPKNGGDVAWAALQNGHTVPPCPVHTTPSGGQHLFFDAPADLHNTAGRLGQGIDTRGVGGYVLVPPSKIINADTGEVFHYLTTREQALSVHPTPPFMDWTIDLLDAGYSRHPSQSDVNYQGRSVSPLPDFGDSPADLLRSRWDWAVELDRRGWTLASRRGDEERWTRPGKNPREGHSATLWLPDGPLVVFTTEQPEGGGVPTRHGEGQSYSPYDFVKAYDFGGDNKATVAWIRGVGPVAVAPGAGGGRATATDDDDTPGDISPPSNLPPEFWAQRPMLAHIHQAAWASMCSPDALLVNVLCRCATLIPPSWKLPGVQQGAFGKPATFDLIGCVLAETSGGKSLAGGVGEMLVPGYTDDDDFSTKPPRYARYGFDLPIGSGEGLVQWFMVPKWRMDSEGEWVKVPGQEQGRTGLFLAVDEGTGFTNQAGRQGTTIVATVASAFSGSTLGQLNAKDETNRLLRGGQARVCVVINMQESNTHLLYTPDLESVGFTGRLLFASALDPAAPRPPHLPDWPGPLRWTPPPEITGGDQFFTYDPAITNEILMVRHGVLTGALEIDKRQSQHLVMRCKLGGILASWEGRTHQSAEDWLIAGQILGGSTTMLRRAEAFRATLDENADQARAIRAANFEMTRDGEKEARLIAKKADEVVAAVMTDGRTRARVLRDMTGGKTRRLWPRIVERAVSSGRVRLVHGWFEPPL